LANLLAILTPASAATFIICGHLWGFTAGYMHSLVLGLALLAFCGLVGNQRLGRATTLDYGLLLFLLLAWAGLWTTAPGAPRIVLANPEVGLWACLFLSALLPLLLGRQPFTTPHTQRRAPHQTWNTAAFKAINRHLSWAWTCLFAACLASSLLPWRLAPLDSPAGRAVCQLGLPLALVLGVGLSLNRIYPGRYLRRHGLPTWQEPAPAAPGSLPSASPTAAQPPSPCLKKEERTL
jgi:hypothetical protein